MFRLSLLPLLTVGILATASAHAATISVAGSFSVTFDPASSSYQGIPEFSGTWSLEFDDSTFVNGQTLPVTTFVSNVAIGATSYTAANTLILINYSSGVVTSVLIGGSPGGVNSVSSINDDFYMYYVSPSSIAVTALSVGSKGGLSSASNSPGSYSVVPEPSSAAFAGVLLALGAARRRR